MHARDFHLFYFSNLLHIKNSPLHIELTRKIINSRRFQEVNWEIFAFLGCVIHFFLKRDATKTSSHSQQYYATSSGKPSTWLPLGGLVEQIFDVSDHLCQASVFLLHVNSSSSIFTYFLKFPDTTSISSFMPSKWHETKLQRVYFNYNINWKEILRVLSTKSEKFYKKLQKWVIFSKLSAYDQNFSMYTEDKL